MASTESSSEYGFFEYIQTYIHYTEEAENSNHLDNFKSSCDFLSGAKEDTCLTLSCLNCQKFLFLLKLMRAMKGKVLHTSDYGFLNFWLNRRLRINDINIPICAKEFYKQLSSKDTDVKAEYELNFKLNDINNDIFENMNILYNLYENYYKIYSDTKTKVECKGKVSCIQHIEACFKEYKKGIIKCPDEQPYFCKELKRFKDKYELIKDISSPFNDFSFSELKELPTYEEVNNEINGEFKMWKNIATTLFSILCAIITIFLYICKFTSFRQRFCTKGKRKVNSRSNLHSFDVPNNKTDMRYNLPYNAVDNT
ncbi:PIR protein [Plasmodium vivax]|nr:PIR protein [Plasmodium vivax]